MSGTSDALLAVIAAGIAIMAIVQVAAIVAGLRVARRVEQLASEIENGVKPLVAHLTALTADATRTATLAAAQVERVDRMLTDVSGRVEQTLASAQDLLGRPAREGRAIISGVRAALAALYEMREVSRRRRAPSVSFEEEEQSLFIG